MNLLLLGADGQLGARLRVALAPLGPVTACGSACDIANPHAIEKVMERGPFDAIVNAAAYTAVDRAQTERERAFAVNAKACSALADAAREQGAWLVHYSTDYVFDGSGTRAWREDDTPAPLNVYGASKLAGEQAIQAGCERHIILRTSWVYEAGRDNFIASILKAACTRDAMTVVDDQWGTPTRADLIARATAHVLRHLEDRSAGLYHFAAVGSTTRLELARFALEHARALGWPLRVQAGDLRAARTSDMPSAAQRPLNSRLDCARFDAAFAFRRPDWQEDVVAALRDWPAPPAP